MRFMKKFSAALVAVAMILGLLAVNVSAKGIEDTAAETKSGVEYTTTLSKFDSYADYKVELAEDGRIDLDFEFEMEEAVVYLYNSVGSSYIPDEIKMTTGSTTYDSYYVAQRTDWHKTFEKAAGTFSYWELL